jgi:two-component system chemotaxis response regulator CheY
VARILVVDDSTTMRQMVSFTLQDAGHEVTEAADGIAALAEAKGGRKFDLVITDVNMPGMNGIDLVKSLRELADFKFTPILVLTTESARREGRARGRRHRLIVAFSPEVLIQTCEKSSTNDPRSISRLHESFFNRESRGDGRHWRAHLESGAARAFRRGTRNAISRCIRGGGRQPGFADRELRHPKASNARGLGIVVGPRTRCLQASTTRGPSPRAMREVDATARSCWWRRCALRPTIRSRAASPSPVCGGEPGKSPSPTHPLRASLISSARERPAAHVQGALRDGRWWPRRTRAPAGAEA